MIWSCEAAKAAGRAVVSGAVLKAGEVPSAGVTWNCMIVRVFGP